MLELPWAPTQLKAAATFRVWAPDARSVHVIGGFIPGVCDRQRYMFYVVGDGGEGPKRDPCARLLETPFPSDCLGEW